MLIRPAEESDIPAWQELARRGDDIVQDMGLDPDAFYAGFDDYMESRVRRGLAFIAVDRMTGGCLGVIAVSRTHNSISYLGVEAGVNIHETGRELLAAALGLLDTGRDITVNVLDTDDPEIRQERDFYLAAGFVERPGPVSENGAPARVMALPGREGKP